MRFLPHISMALSVPAAITAVNLGVETVLPVLIAVASVAVAAQMAHEYKTRA